MTPQSHNSYSLQFHEQAIAMVTELGKTRPKLPKNLRVSLTTINRWVSHAIGTVGTGSGSHNKRPTTTPDVHTIHEELLRRNRELEQEIRVFKKGCGLLREGVRCDMKFEFIAKEKGHFPVAWIRLSSRLGAH